MGLETIALIGLSALRANSAMKEGKAQAKAIAQEGTLKATNKAKEVAYQQARLRQSFLSSGITLEGTPMSVLNETLETGQADINQIITNANTASKNAISGARSQALNSLASSFAGASLGSLELPTFGAGLEQDIGRAFAPGTTGYGPQTPIWNS